MTFLDTFNADRSHRKAGINLYFIFYTNITKINNNLADPIFIKKYFYKNAFAIKKHKHKHIQTFFIIFLNIKNTLKK